jgi:hypothetical protein
VNYLADSLPNATFCSPVSGPLCNLRSAWAACASVFSCTIYLPAYETVSLSSNVSFGGELKLTDKHNVTVVGQGATVICDEGNAKGCTTRLFFYEAASSFFDFFDDDAVNVDNDVTAPTLRVFDLTIKDFGSSSLDGGAVYAVGSSILSFTNVTFQSTTGSDGGSIYISDNLLHDVTVDRCVFVRCSAKSNGGAIYLYENIKYLTVKASKFTHCTAENNGGAVTVSDLSQGVSFEASTFSFCSAGSGGAGEW